MIGIGSLEFLSAQVPFSMKGIMLGVSYGSIFLVGTIGIVVMLSFERKLPIWNTGAFSCGFWYALSMLIVEVIVFYFGIADAMV